MWNGGRRNEREKLAQCYRNSLALALENNCNSIAFPSISTGIFRFPKDKAAKIAVHEVKEFLKRNTIEVLFVCFDDETEKLIMEQVETN